MSLLNKDVVGITESPRESIVVFNTMMRDGSKVCWNEGYVCFVGPLLVFLLKWGKMVYRVVSRSMCMRQVTYSLVL